MRAQHTAHSFPAFPVYSSAFIADDQVLVGAGGGASRTGIKNKLVSLLRVGMRPLTNPRLETIPCI